MLLKGASVTIGIKILVKETDLPDLKVLFTECLYGVYAEHLTTKGLFDYSYYFLGK